jgi:biopolymer transport protein ExbD
MKRQPFFFTWVLCLVLLSGCMTTTTTRAPKNTGRAGVTVEVHEDGTQMLYGNPIDRKTLARRLIREEGADKGRAVIIEAHGDVRRAKLADLRNYLVSRRIPNVVIVTQRNAIVHEGRSGEALPATGFQGASRPESQ